MAFNFQILYLDDRLVVIDKPAGFHVHPPETNPEKVPREKIVLNNLRDQLGKWVYPIHRLDAGTSGILMMGLDSEAARLCAEQFQKQSVEKTYWAVVRGFSKPEGIIESELKNDSTGAMWPARTEFKTLRQMEVDAQVGKKFPMARYSWLEVHPKTGRFHQIRRHLNRISHPVVGDSTHGDSRHNSFFREKLGIGGLCLRSICLEMELPWLKERKTFQAPPDAKWEKLKFLFEESVPGSALRSASVLKS